MKKQLGPQDIMFPTPAALIVSGDFENPNIITIAWIGVMGVNPPIIGISLNKNRYSLELIEKLNCFSINLPSADYAKEVDYCGIITGRKAKKFEDTKFTPIKSLKIKSPIIKECPFNFECNIVNTLDFNKWTVVFGEVLETHIDTDKINGEKFKDIDVKKMNPLIYIPKIREYYNLGEKIGNGFDIGFELKNT